MMGNILTAIKSLVENPVLEIRDYYHARIRINNIGGALETYIRDMFANSISLSSEEKRIIKYNEIFSYLGNQNNPPDIIIRDGDAIEVKKIQALKSSLALNSSYPKNKLFSDSPMITRECRACEEWIEKDLIYCIGSTNDKRLLYLYMIYGTIYAASKEKYERVRDHIARNINQIPDVEFSETRELGRVNKVDPLGITDLRIRGMWHIQNPVRVFQYVYEFNEAALFQMVAIIPTEKYFEFSEEDRRSIERISKENFLIKDVRIKNPNNPADLINCKLILFLIK